MSNHVYRNVSLHESSEKECLILMGEAEFAEVRQTGNIKLDNDKVCKIREAMKNKEIQGTVLEHSSYVTSG